MRAGLDFSVYEQVTPSTSWVVTHNLGRLTNVDVAINFEGTLEKAIPLKIAADPSLIFSLGFQY